MKQRDEVRKVSTGWALLKIGTNQNWRIGGKKGEADASSQIVTHLFVFFCYVAEYLST